jgi:CheY-like chemotaxis protein
LGLPISKQFVNLMGGELTVKSIVEQGTTFRVQLPVIVASEDAVEGLDMQSRRRITRTEPGQTAPDGGPFRLLIVEDNTSNRELLIKLLTPFGFELRAAVDGAQGVELWEQWQPHLVWMDMRLPVMDGYEATRQIKARTEAMDRSTVIVALTASAFEEDRDAILAAGCDDFIRKPFRENEIFDTLHRHLGVRFVYETVTPVLEVGASITQEGLRSAVKGLPAALVNDLYEAAVALDVKRVLALVKAVRPQAPHLANTLDQWMHNFEFDKLLILTKPH